MWGGAKSSYLKPVTQILQKAWRKIGKFKQHTLNRLQNLGILKLEDELAIQESKILWKWENNKLPNSLMVIVEEKVDRFRGRRFHLKRNSKTESIHARLSKRANTSIDKISSASSKKVMSNNLKKDILTSKYNFNCSTRNCFVCN